MRRLGWLAAGGLLSLLSGCPGPAPGEDPPPVDPPIGPPVSDARFLDPRVHDDSPASLDNAPPSISGGTLHVLSTARLAIVADPDRDRISVVDLTARAILASTTHLPPGAEPTRIAEDVAGRVHVVLRGTGELYTFEPEAVDEGVRRAVCAMPRGVAYDSLHDQLHVACRGGELVTLPAAGGAAVRSVMVDPDLRDVVVRGDRLFVSRFRTAELVEVDAEGAPIGQRTPVASLLFGGVADPAFPAEDDFRQAVFEPAVAWRTISATETDDVAMVHQRASEEEVPTEEPGGYGGTGGCESSIVHSSVTFFRGDGTVSEGPDLARATLPVDIAISPVLESGLQYVAVVAAGNESGESVFLYQRSSLEHSGAGSCVFPEEMPTEPVPNATSAAFAQDGSLVVLARDVEGFGARLAVVGRDRSVSWIDLGGGSAFDTGHAVFHANSGGFIACASCHPEGGEDGRVWTFGAIGPRRTPAMHGDLTGTEPFHWDGDMADLSHLVHEVFTGRMRGPTLHGAQIGALGRWIDELPAPVASAPSDAAAVARGRELFNGAAQCGACHSGALLTNNQTVDVGTGGRFQVPSLIGVSFRTPVMHSGCANTLEARFDSECGGGDRHGLTSNLDRAQIDDLVAYMRTL